MEYTIVASQLVHTSCVTSTALRHVRPQCIVCAGSCCRDQRCRDCGSRGPNCELPVIDRFGVRVTFRVGFALSTPDGVLGKAVVKTTELLSSVERAGADPDSIVIQADDTLPFCDAQPRKLRVPPNPLASTNRGREENPLGEARGRLFAEANWAA